MRLTRTRAVVVGLTLAVTTAACGNAGSDDSGKNVEADKDAAASLPAGTHMKELADKGEITIGVKFDQPGLGFKDAASDVPTGFDVEIAKILVAGLGIDPASDKVKWVETISDNRSRSCRRARSTWFSRRTPSPTNGKQMVGQTAPTWSPASRSW